MKIEVWNAPLVKISCTHSRNGIRLQVLQSHPMRVHAGLIPPLLPLSAPSEAESWARSSGGNNEQRASMVYRLIVSALGHC